MLKTYDRAGCSQACCWKLSKPFSVWPNKKQPQGKSWTQRRTKAIMECLSNGHRRPAGLQPCSYEFKMDIATFKPDRKRSKRLLRKD